MLLLYFLILDAFDSERSDSLRPARLLYRDGHRRRNLFQIAVNVGMVVGLMPVTGIPLPLMSYGGSSILFTFLALGIVMNIRMRRFVN